MAIIDGEGIIQIDASLEADANLVTAATATASIFFTMEGNIIAAPRVLSASALSSTEIRVRFDQPMSNDSRLVDVSAYTAFPNFGGAQVYVSAVEPENVVNPQYVDLTVNEMTDGQGYTVEVDTGPSAPVNRLGLSLNTGANFAVLTGVGVRPTILRVVPVAIDLVDIVFSEPMLDNAAIRNADKYSFDGGLSVLAVQSLISDTVRLVTSDQTPGALYNLTIS